MKQQYTATEVGSYFIQQYYAVFNVNRDQLHKFYSDQSSLLIVDGDITTSASNIDQIHGLIMSSNVMGIEITSTNSLESLNGGVLVVASGLVEYTGFIGSRKFVQTFFLAPREECDYVVLNDVFHFVNEEMGHQVSSSDEPEQDQHTHINGIEPEAVSEEPCEQIEMPDHEDMPELESFPEESVDLSEQMTYDIESLSEESVDESEQITYAIESFPEESVDQPEQITNATDIQEPQTFMEGSDEQTETVSEESEPENSTECSSILEMSDFPTLQELYGQLHKSNHCTEMKLESSSAKTAGQGETSSYAGMVNGKSRPSVSNGTVPSSIESGPTRHKLDSNVRESRAGDSCSIYVKNLPSTITTLDVLYELKRFGRIKPDGVFLRKNHQGSGAPSAFVEFQNVQGATNAIKASPIRMGGRNVYIERKRSKVGASDNNSRNGSVRTNGHHQSP